MKIEIANLTEDGLRGLPEWDTYPFSCKYCTYWEFPSEHSDQTSETKDATMRRKSDWLRSVNGVFGNCGKIAYVDGFAAGYAQYAPPEFFPNTANYAAAPPTHDAAFLSCLFVPHGRFRGLGLATRLLDGVLTDLGERGIHAVETFARKSGANNPSGPAGFFLVRGFSVYRDDVEFPLLRRVLRQAEEGRAESHPREEDERNELMAVLQPRLSSGQGVTG